MASQRQQPFPDGGARRDSKSVRDVLEILRGQEVPLTAQQLFMQLRLEGNAVGLATIYRALHVLREQGRLHEFHVPTGSAFRACTPKPHHHLLCTRCGRVQERPLGPAPLAWTREMDNENFTFITDRVEMHGICRRCGSPHPERQEMTGLT